VPGGLDILSLAVGTLALAAIALAFWIAPEIRDVVREHRLRGQIRRALDEAYAEMFGDVSETPSEMRVTRKSHPSGGRIGKVEPPATHTANHTHGGSVTKP